TTFEPSTCTGCASAAFQVLTQGELSQALARAAISATAMNLPMPFIVDPFCKGVARPGCAQLTPVLRCATLAPKGYSGSVAVRQRTGVLSRQDRDLTCRRTRGGDEHEIRKAMAGLPAGAGRSGRPGFRG